MLGITDKILEGMLLVECAYYLSCPIFPSCVFFRPSWTTLREWVGWEEGPEQQSHLTKQKETKAKTKNKTLQYLLKKLMCVLTMQCEMVALRDRQKGKKLVWKSLDSKIPLWSSVIH